MISYVIIFGAGVLAGWILKKKVEDDQKNNDNPGYEKRSEGPVDGSGPKEPPKGGNGG